MNTLGKIVEITVGMTFVITLGLWLGFSVATAPRKWPCDPNAENRLRAGSEDDIERCVCTNNVGKTDAWKCAWRSVFQ